ncbi:IclR family transcriptional regulator [Granulicella sp. WH15]|uniref:IclR family transcriptional regulator n=1 Tax=Granulicella sp. WH15 TaxID=2602070 RepID=UPI001366FDEC|nr:IclR family transcriptional regulator [Granulicella sp. WH15]QHN04853.1 IclR family transcriptional regulator [Granulicella sp. WH15]
MAVPRKAYPTPALEKGLDILELFAREPMGLTKSEVARRLERSVSEIFRMLLCLEERGYIARAEGDDRFRLTLRLFHLAQEHPPTKRLIAEAEPIMQDVAHKLRQSCHLGVLNDANVVILAQVDSPISPGFSVRPGSVVDLMRAASGHVILSFLSDHARTRVLEQWQGNTHSKVPRDLETHLRSIRKRGFEERESYEIQGVINVSFPVLDERHTAIAALTVPYLARIGESIDVKTVRAILKTASERLSSEMGFKIA